MLGHGSPNRSVRVHPAARTKIRAAPIPVMGRRRDWGVATNTALASEGYSTRATGDMGGVARSLRHLHVHISHTEPVALQSSFRQTAHRIVYLASGLGRGRANGAWF